LTQFNESLNFLKKHLNVCSEIKEVKRKDIYEIPLKALREALAAVLELIKQDSFISRKDLSKKLNINESAVQKHLDTLKDKMVIKRVGADKGDHWEVL